MTPIVSADASPGFAKSVLSQDPPIDPADYLAVADHYFAGLGLDPTPDTTPTAENMRQAKVILRDQLLNGFPFADMSASAHALAMVLQPLARPLIAGPTPLYVISGLCGSGKTSLLKAAVLPYQEAKVVNTTGVRVESEWQKTLCAGLSLNPTHFFIDGQASCLSSPALCQALTADAFFGRLPYSRIVTAFPIRCTWAFALEEPKMSQEIANRAVHIPLTGPERSERLHCFKGSSLSADQLFVAALTLIRGWLEAGQPRFTDEPSRCTEWSQIMGGILEVAGVPGFLHHEE